MKEKPQKKITPFDFITSINSGPKGKDLLEDATADQQALPDPDSPEKAYVSFMVNRGLSYFQDSVLFANEMNLHAHLPPKMQYDFLRHGIRPRKRFSKWFKKIPDSKDIQIIMKEYGYSSTRAYEVLPLFSQDALMDLHKKHDKGGKA